MNRNMCRFYSMVSCILILAAIPFIGFASGSKSKGIQQETMEQELKASEIERDEQTFEDAKRSAKYVFCFIGDGMGLPQINAAEIYLASTSGSEIGVKKLSFSEFPAQGLTTTYSSDSFITDSAAAATAIATGYKTNSGVISMNQSKTENYKTIAEMAQEKGMKVGIISSVSIDHATPACFYAHTPSRKNYYEIGLALANSSFDFFGGGGLLSPKGKKGDQPDVVEMARAKGFKVVNSRSDFDALRPGAGKVFAYDGILDRDKALNYEIDRTSEEISLAEYTKKAIELLDNGKGFFLMVEGGKIDWACHANDAASAIQDTIAFDAAVKEALRFYNRHQDETLIVVTGDHECGGMTIGFAGTQYSTFFDKIEKQKLSYLAFDNELLKPYKESRSASTARFSDIEPEIERYFGLFAASEAELAEMKKKAESGDYGAAQSMSLALTPYELSQLQAAFKRSVGGEIEKADDQYTYLLYGGYEPLTVTITHILNQKAGIGWTSYSHTGIPVPTFAIGVGQEMFDGYYDNTDIGRKMMDAMDLAVVLASVK